METRRFGIAGEKMRASFERMKKQLKLKLKLDKTSIQVLTSMDNVRGGYPVTSHGSCTTESYCYCFSLLGVTC